MSGRAAGKQSWQKLAKYDPADFGISGDRTEHVLWRITHGELDGIKPKVTVVMIGTNNVGHFQDEQPEWAAAGVKKIVETIREKLPETKVLLLGVFPRDAKDSPHPQEGRGHRTRSSRSSTTARRPATSTSVRNSSTRDGEIPKDIMPDRLHPNAKGYDLWYDAMRPLLEKMMGE